MASSLIELAKGRGRKPLLYSAVSVIAVLTSQIVLVLCHAVIELSAEWSNVIAVAAGTIPSYELNRSWVWGKSSKSHLWKEVVPFWAMSFLGLALSTVFVHLAEDRAQAYSDNRAVQTLIIQGAALAAFGVLWVAKFIILNKVMFAHHEQDLEDMSSIP